jgi:hypothetical protein
MTLVIFLILLFAGFFFPPIWALLALYGLWIGVLKAPMRAMVIKKDIQDMVNRGETLDKINVQFKDAVAYARLNGGHFDGHQATITLFFNGHPKLISFKQADRGTWVRFED